MRVYVAVVDRQSFAQASEALGLSKSATSKHIQFLEARLGTRLLNRTTRRLSLTEAGEGYYQSTVQILKTIEETEQAAKEATAQAAGTVRVNAPLSYGISHISPLLPDFLRQYPKVDINVTMNDRFVDLIDEGFDMAVRLGQLQDSTLFARRLASYPIHVCASPGYLAEHGVPATPADLSRHNVLTYTQGEATSKWSFNRRDHTAAAPCTVAVGGNFHANNGDVLRGLALDGIGIIRLPQFLVGPHLQDGSLVEILSDYTAGEVTAYAVYPTNRHLPMKVRILVDYLVHCLRDNAAPVPERTAKPAAATALPA